MVSRHSETYVYCKWIQGESESFGNQVSLLGGSSHLVSGL